MGEQSVQYDSSAWTRRAGARREWILTVTERHTPVSGRLGQGQVIPDELLTVAGLDLDLTDEQRTALAREEVAAVTSWEIRFEALLEAGFAGQIATARDVTAPRLTFMLHEIKEETGHQRMFQELLKQLAPTTRSPLPHWLLTRVLRRSIRAMVRCPALLFTIVLAGEEVVDVFQEAVADHPGTDPYVRAVYEYHRDEEADHVSFGSAVYPESWVDTSRVDRALVRWVAPAAISAMVDWMVHPHVYAAAGLPARATWQAARRTPERAAYRRGAARPVLETLIEAGAVRPGCVPRPWRRLSHVDRHARPL